MWDAFFRSFSPWRYEFHAAFKMGETAAENAMGKQVKCSLLYVPSCIYSLPECAGVGLTEEKAAAEKGWDNISIGKFPFAANGRALASAETAGFVKVIVGKRDQELLGVHIFGGLATEMISEAASLMAAEIPADEIAQMIHAHPSYSEAFMEACADASDQCMHLPKKRNRKMHMYRPFYSSYALENGEPLFKLPTN